MTIIAYYTSPSGNTKRFAKKIGLPSIQIPFRYGKIGEIIKMETPYVLICPTYKTIKSTYVPQAVKQFLRDNNNYKLMCGVIGTGNRNFGVEFCKTAELISKKFNTPIIGEIELSGMPGEEKTLREKILQTIQERENNDR